GHGVGDATLREIAARIKACVGAGDTVSRHDGDSFYVLVCNVGSGDSPGGDPRTHAREVAVRLLSAVAEPLRVSGTEIVLAATIGIACFPESRNGSYSDAETLMRNAEIAMYASKDSSRGGYQFYSTAMNARTQDRVILEG